MINLIVAAGLIVVLGIAYNLYRNVIMSKNYVKEALSGVDVQLKKRCDLIPNILTIAKKFMEHESELFEKITALRSAAMNAVSGTKEKFLAEAELDTQLRALMVNVENYPQLKSDATMLEAMSSYKTIEEEIAVARKYYNAKLTELRNLIEIFPGSLFASFAADARNYTWFETDEASKSPVDASKYL